MKRLLATAAVAAFAGCVGVPHSEQVQFQRMQYVQAHPEISEKTRRNILDGRIAIGMKADEVLASSGKPWDTSRTASSLGVSETWWYGRYGEGPVVVVHLFDEIVESWTENR